jgi:DHA2 family multidrug resistance protein
MQGSFAASVDEVTWIVTSYLVATGIIPLTGWIAARLGWCSISRCSMRGESVSYHPIYLAARPFIS